MNGLHCPAMLRFKLGPKRCLELGQANDLALVSYHLIQILKRGRVFSRHSLKCTQILAKDQSMVLTLSVALALIPGCGFGANPCESGWPHRVVIWPRALSSVCFFSSVHVCIVTWNSAIDSYTRASCWGYDDSGRAEAFNMLSCLGPNCLGVSLGKLG